MLEKEKNGDDAVLGLQFLFKITTIAKKIGVSPKLNLMKLVNDLGLLSTIPEPGVRGASKKVEDRTDILNAQSHGCRDADREDPQGRLCCHCHTGCCVGKALLMRLPELFESPSLPSSPGSDAALKRRAAAKPKASPKAKASPKVAPKASPKAQAPAPKAAAALIPNVDKGITHADRKASKELIDRKGV
uniref:Uncharacterized protein n=1 Tax=Chromera velia CCMP2878 TaxID=1169474 RepID=A0A0G4HIU8_9ALVE|eukprot:Cvel_1094.t1-p1 / transcript=Cvel_1094.t1 / gene=Cvel_1094 / organism=Chromera_velia_CCMP2878 / gene_product=hypothetical protein / transcript_product=hypothetical protein / location=Cvel_scaffold35:122739-123406(-) / protein_length=188 / sequence_SO=supercontig / SO=protein_coding / is_pseudo=false